MSLTNWILSALLLLLQSIYAYYEECDQIYNLNSSYTSYLESPYYPKDYPAGTSCRYKFIAPLDHYIELKCDINIHVTSAGCTTDSLYLDRDGDEQMRDSENFCGKGSFERTSAFRSLVLAYISVGKNAGRFRCKLTATRQSCDCGWSLTTRIVNGKLADKNEFPSMAALKYISGNQQSFCGASIISHYHLLTAAHCAKFINNVQNIVAIVGTNDLMNPTSSKYYAQYGIKQMIVHENYERDEYVDLNDIAILVATSVIDWSRGVAPTCLPPPEMNNKYNHVNVIGWGSVSFAGPISSNLLKTNLMVVSNADCQNQYQGTGEIKLGHVCTYDLSGKRSDSCQLDSGGPVIFANKRQYIVGIIISGKTCAANQNPIGVNTRVTHYLKWIFDKIGYAICNTTTTSLKLYS